MTKWLTLSPAFQSACNEISEHVRVLPSWLKNAERNDDFQIGDHIEHGSSTDEHDAWLELWVLVTHPNFIFIAPTVDMKCNMMMRIMDAYFKNFSKTEYYRSDVAFWAVTRYLAASGVFRLNPMSKFLWSLNGEHPRYDVEGKKMSSQSVTTHQWKKKKNQKLAISDYDFFDTCSKLAHVNLDDLVASPQIYFHKDKSGKYRLDNPMVNEQILWSMDRLLLKPIDPNLKVGMHDRAVQSETHATTSPS